jgi:cell division septum initiation protein DivIVA
MKAQAHASVSDMIATAERKAFELQMEAQVEANERMQELAVSSQRIKAAETRLREGLNQLEAVLAMTRFDLEQAPGGHAPSPPGPSPWRSVTASEARDT